MTQQRNNSTEEDEIDLIQLAKTLWNGRKTVIKTTLIFMVIGLFIAIFSPKEYTASTTFVPQTKDSKVGGNLGGLAAMAGINLGGIGGDSGISPELYPQIINSIPFQLELLQTPLTITGQTEKVSFTNYYNNIHSLGVLSFIKKYTIDLPGIVISALKGRTTNNQQPTTNNQLLTITPEEHEIIKQLNDQIGLDVNVKEGYVTISANMPEAIASAELAFRAEELLHQYVIDFKIQKSNDQLEFIKARYLDADEKFKVIKQKLASERDRNKYLSTALSKTASEILQDDYNLIYGVHAELAKQLEAQYIKVTEDTPVFTVLKPVTVPLERSKPNRPMILMIWSFLGGIIGVGMVFGRTFVLDVKEKWNE